MDFVQALPVRRGKGGGGGAFPNSAEKGVQTTEGGPGNYSTIPHCCNMDTLSVRLQGKRVKLGGEKGLLAEYQSQDRTPVMG